MQLKLHKPTMAIGYSLRMRARHVDSTNPGRSNFVFRSKPIPEAEMSNRLIALQPAHNGAVLKATSLGRMEPLSPAVTCTLLMNAVML